MRLEQLHYILEVAKLKSITKAARQLYLAQPSLSSAISNLEQELRIKIFNRKPEGVEPTDQGQIVLEKAQHILEEIEELANLCSDPLQNLKGTVTISSPPAMMHILLDVLIDFKKNYPLVNFTIKEDDNLGIIRDLRSGDIDLGIIATTKSESDLALFQTIKSFCYEKLFTDKTCLVVAAEHELLKPESARVDPPQSYPLIIFKNNWSEADLAQVIHFKYSYLLRFNDIEIIKKMVARSNAVSLLARIAFLNDIYVTSGKIVPIEIAGVDTEINIGIVYRKDYVTTALKKFIMTLKEGIHTMIAE